MTDATLSQALKEAYASAPAAETILHTLEFRHPSFTVPIRVVLDYQDLTATLEASAPLNPSTAVNFTAYAFDLVLPELGVGGTPEITISIDNVSHEIVSYIDAAAQTPDLIEVTYRPFLASTPAVPQMDPPLTLVVTAVTADVFRVQCTAAFGDVANRKFPSETYTAERFPGLVTS
jgi:hypothetical protein